MRPELTHTCLEIVCDNLFVINMDEERKIDEAEIAVLNSILERNHSFAQQLDTYANIMIALSSAIFIVSFSQLKNDFSPFWIILGVTTGLATILSLLMIRPPRKLRKRGQKESLMFKSKIMSYKSADEYGDQLYSMLDSREKIIHQYSTEIYNVAKFYYQPKKASIFLARNVLLAGITVSLILFFRNLKSY